MAMDLPFEGEKGPETRAGAAADRSPVTCGLGDNVRDVEGELCVVVEQRLVLGVLEGDALLDGSRTAGEAMTPGPSTFRPSIPKEELAAWLDDHERPHTLLTTLDGRLVGVVRREALGL
jgi:hypothetical protein